MASSSEPVTTRKFKDARTEPISVQSELMLKLCQGFISQATKKQKFSLLLDAIKEHSTKVKNAIHGKGFERHLSALRSAFIQKVILSEPYPNLPTTRTASDDGEIPPFIFDPSLDLH
ncbi:hypothetical protein CANARDRAFT_107614 [[Candida] arabinofermentans NRRL YB-2248]|uniref:Choline/carnitine acyltransferase domain-containing protein n=1 Tax=[Candida] arabinofermentans NRRL YB-2248 TaxID=983967 RepID=A0A1E4STZ5_9ASCO|nr:hypothetical protein CANARDRAFT_107614 [[Candida] arabinofermentans NRRL YB-2248]